MRRPGVRIPLAPPPIRLSLGSDCPWAGEAGAQRRGGRAPTIGRRVDSIVGPSRVRQGAAFAIASPAVLYCLAVITTPLTPGTPQLDPALATCLLEMHRLYQADPIAAVRGQSFIKTLHHYLAKELATRLHPAAIRRGVRVVEEAHVLGSHKPKDVDVAIVDPISGPLVLIGVRSQMSSVANNVLTYYQDIVGECVSLQDRYPMSVFGYVYLHPLRAQKGSGPRIRVVDTDYQRYAKLYAAIGGRDDTMYRHLHGVYDHFAYMLVDFNKDPIELRDDLVAAAVRTDLQVSTMIDRIVATAKNRTVWLDLFK